MSGPNQDRITQLNEQNTLAVTATATLTVGQILNNAVIALSNAVAATLPPAAESMAGLTRKIVTAAASATIVVAAGFGGAGASYDVVTIRYGEMSLVYCDGTYWYALTATVPAAS